MARLSVEGDDLVLSLSSPEKLLALHGDVRVPLNAARSLVLDPHAWSAMRGVRLGTSIPGLLFYGTRRHAEGKDFGAVLARRPVVRVDLDERSPFARLIVSVRDADTTAAAVRAAAGI